MDQEEFLREMAVEILSFNGIEVKTFENGNKLLEEFLKNTHPKNTHPDIIVLDLNVFDGKMGANATIKALRGQGYKGKAIVSSGYTADDEIVYPKKYGFDGSLSKPYRMNNLLEAVNM